MVPSARVELVRVSPQDSKSCVYTSFTTKARPGVPEGSRTLNLGFGTPHYIRLATGTLALPVRFELTACRLGGGRSNPTELREQQLLF